MTRSIVLLDARIAVYGTRLSTTKLPCADVKDELATLLKGRRLRVVNVKLGEIHMSASPNERR